MIVCLDEFQNIRNFHNPDELERKLRANWQRHKHVTYCLYGSKRHMMSEIFNGSSKPFYRFGDIMHLTKIDALHWQKFIVEGFEKSGKHIHSETALLIAQVMKNHSWYVQQLAHYTWNATAKKATMEDVNRAITEVIQANAPLYQREMEILSATQLHLLKAIAKGETRLTAASVMREYHLGTPRNVSKNKTILVNNDIIQQSDGAYEFLDPSFEPWYRKQYCNQSYLLTA